MFIFLFYFFLSYLQFSEVPQLPLAAVHTLKTTELWNTEKKNSNQ